MGKRADALATKLEAAHNDLLAVAEGASGDEWRSTCADGGWSKGYAAYHVAANVEGICGMARMLAGGQAPPAATPVTWDEINAMNADHAREHANCTAAETIALLRRDGPAAVAFVRGLGDEALDRRVAPMMAGMPETNVEQFVEMVLIGHTLEHLQMMTGAR